MARLVWLCFVSKLIEMLESFVFILRKKNKQLSFLHVYHHTMTAVYCWGVTKYISGGSAYVPIAMNTFVHSFMYLYYALAAFGPKMQKYLWWKRYLTTLQLIQFFLIVTLAAGVFLIPCDERIRNFAFIGGAYTISLAALFLHFYRKTYTDISNVVKNGEMGIKKNK